MWTISLCIIVKNEEKNLAACLTSLKDVVDEIIVADTGSTDGTREVARQFTPHVLDFVWCDDFAAARNFAFEHATKDYILWLDADDVLLPEDRARLLELKQNLPADVDAVMMKYNTGFDAQGNVTFSYYRERLVRRSCGFRWREPVHEYLETGGKVISTDICVTHTKRHAVHSDRNLRIYEALLAQGKELSPRGLYYYARELKDNGRFEDAIRGFERFLNDGQGWVEDNIAACAELGYCYGRLHDTRRQMESLVRSFTYHTPRAEICCQLGYAYKGMQDYGRAAFWFRLAAILKKPENSWGFLQPDCWGYIPCIELAVCYDRMGRWEEASRWNEVAALFKPGDSAVSLNREYFKGKQGSSETDLPDSSDPDRSVD